MFSRSRCFYHWIYEDMARKGLTRGVLSQNNKSKRDKFCAHLEGRYVAILAGNRNPVGEEEARKDAYDIRQRLNITWAGPVGVVKMAMVIRMVEKRGKERRDEIR